MSNQPSTKEPATMNTATTPVTAADLARMLYCAAVTQTNNAFLATCTATFTKDTSAIDAHNAELLRLNEVYTAEIARIANTKF